MAILGIDFGTTNSVVACYDRGNYPVVPHYVQTRIGRVSHEVYPSIMYYDLEGKKLSFGLEAERLMRNRPPGAGLAVRSLKRVLGAFNEGMTLDSHYQLKVKELLIGFLASLRRSIESSGLFTPGEPLECIIAWPAHANGAQRAVTRDAFREAGFTVLGSINEPTASAIEYADRVAGGNPRTARKLSDRIAVFDLGGGTFDASLLEIDQGRFEVVDSIGLEDLGGDDFDQVLCEMFARRLKIDLDAMDITRRQTLLMHARTQKEAIGNQGAKSLLLNPEDLGLAGKPEVIRTHDYLRKIRPMALRAIDRLEELLQRPAARRVLPSRAELSAIYLVGGSSKLPLIQDLIGARFPGVTIISTHKPFTSVAVGAAIYASQRVEVRDIFSRHFGVYRLLDHGTRDYFDTIFPAGTRIPTKDEPPIERVLTYAPHHNIGHLRFLECTDFDDAGLPAGAIRAWSDVLFPYDPSLPPGERVRATQIAARPGLAGTLVEERYRCDSDGVITVELSRQSDGQKRVFEIFYE